MYKKTQWYSFWHFKNSCLSSRPFDNLMSNHFILLGRSVINSTMSYLILYMKKWGATLYTYLYRFFWEVPQKTNFGWVPLSSWKMSSSMFIFAKSLNLTCLLSYFEPLKRYWCSKSSMDAPSMLQGCSNDATKVYCS